MTRNTRRHETGMRITRRPSNGKNSALTEFNRYCHDCRPVLGSLNRRIPIRPKDYDFAIRPTLGRWPALRDNTGDRSQRWQSSTEVRFGVLPVNLVSAPRPWTMMSGEALRNTESRPKLRSGRDVPGDGADRTGETPPTVKRFGVVAIPSEKRTKRHDQGNR